MNDIKDRLLWRADSAGDGFHSDMIYRDALRYIDMLQIEIERLRAALGDARSGAVDASKIAGEACIRASAADAEIERLRAALGKIMQKCPYARRDKWCACLDCDCIIARAALAGEHIADAGKKVATQEAPTALAGEKTND